MSQTTRSKDVCLNTEAFTVPMPNNNETEDMTREDRERLVLNFMARYKLALPPRVIYRNIRLRDNAVFSFSSLNNYLAALVEQGLLARVDPDAVADRKLVETDPGDAYYIITEKGLGEADTDVVNI